MGLDDVFTSFVEAISGANGPVPAIVAGIVALILAGVLVALLGAGELILWLFVGVLALLGLGLGGAAIARAGGR